ncbi:MAG: hypothetical protein V4556_01240 [Bacteroidota bacterium]
MIFKKDNFWLGFVLGLIAPFLGFLFFRYRHLSPLSYWDALQYIFVQPGHAMLTAAISVSLLANAIIFTLYVNVRKDKTAKGIFTSTCIYAVIVLCFKIFS